MVIKDLKQIMADAEAAGMDDSTIVIMAIDPEGNGFRPLDEAGHDYWSDHYQQVFSEQDKENLDIPRCLTLWPL